MISVLSDIEMSDLRELFQSLSNKHGLIFSVCWSQNAHEAFTPQKETNGQLILDGMEMPKITEFQESGE